MLKVEGSGQYTGKRQRGMLLMIALLSGHSIFKLIRNFMEQELDRLLFCLFIMDLICRAENRGPMAGLSLLTITRGYVHTNRFFPLFSVKKEEDFETGYALWPLYSWRKHELEDYEIKKKAIAYFLYKDVQNIPKVEGGRDSRAINLWPLFTYRRTTDDKAYFNFISPLETFLQDNAPRERNWVPIWTIFRWDRDEEGNHVSSFLCSCLWMFLSS